MSRRLIGPRGGGASRFTSSNQLTRTSSSFGSVSDSSGFIIGKSPDGKLMALPVPARSGFEAGVPKALFEARAPGVIIPFPASYVVAANGQRFPFNTVVEDDATSAPVTLVVHWTAGLKKE